MLIPYALMKEGSNSLFNKVLLLGSMISLIKANQFVKELIGGIGIDTNFRTGIAGIASMIRKYNMKKYIFPLNFDYSSKFLGILEYKLLFPLCFFAVILGYFISSFHLSIISSIYLFIIIYLPIFLFTITTIVHEPLIHFFFTIIKHYLTASIYKKL